MKPKELLKEYEDLNTKYTNLKRKYDDIVNEEFGWKNKMEGWQGGCIIFGMISIILFIFVCFALDNIDIDDKLGPYLCGKHGLIFDSAEERGFTYGDWDSNKYLKIYCKKFKQPNITKISDNYLYEIIGGE